jgi:hypothetical protein
LLAQLRSVTPALSESDITQERLALEESIRKVEAEAARQFVETSRQPPGPKIRKVDEARRREASPDDQGARDEDDDPTAPPPRRYVNPPAAAQEGRAEATRKSRPSPSVTADGRRPRSVFEQAPPTDLQHPPTPGQQQRHPLRPPINERRSPPDSIGKDFRLPDLSDAAAASPREPTDAFAALPPPAIDLDRLARVNERETRAFEPQAQQDRFEPRPHEGFSEPMLESAFALDDSRPVASNRRRTSPDTEPEAEEPGEDLEEARARPALATLIKGAAIAAAVAAVSAALVWQWPRMVDGYRSFRAPPTELARETPAPATPKKTQERVEPGTAQQSTAPAVPQLAAVAQKVVLYEEDPADPNGKRFVGSAIWRTETVTPAPGQPAEVAVRADVEVPERKLAMTWLLRRNTDRTLPATHTVEIMFKLPADFPSGGITNVPGILMKQAEQTRGVPLAGSAVKVTNAFYLIGLSNVEADKERNVQLLKERAWFDIPVVYSNNRRAILAMEKGTPGERVFADAFKAWKQ